MGIIFVYAVEINVIFVSLSTGGLDLDVYKRQVVCNTTHSIVIASSQLLCLNKAFNTWLITQVENEFTQI